MLNRFWKAGTWVVALALATGAAQAQNQPIPRATSKLSTKALNVSVEYGKPALNGRTVDELIGQLQPGQVWRMGADKSTTFSTSKELAFGDASVPAGDYSLWMRKEADGGWKLVFNKQTGQWGTEHEAAQDLIAVPLVEKKSAKNADVFQVDVTGKPENAVLDIRWGDRDLSASFKAK